MGEPLQFIVDICTTHEATWTQAADRHNDLTTFTLPPVLEESTTQYRLPFDEAPPTVRPPIFTAEVLAQVQNDIEATVLPSWLEKVPKKFGTAGHGKLKADHWRSACIVNLVITLVRLWGTPQASGDELDALKNFMHLVIAVDFASRRSMTEARAAAYDYHMEQYLRGLRRIYNYVLVPNHHMALHLKVFLLLFGPVHGWWTFPFERYNGLLQRVKTNFDAGEFRCGYLRASLTQAFDS